MKYLLVLLLPVILLGQANPSELGSGDCLIGANPCGYLQTIEGSLKSAGQTLAGMPTPKITLGANVLIATEGYLYGSLSPNLAQVEQYVNTLFANGTGFNAFSINVDVSTIANGCTGASSCAELINIFRYIGNLSPQPSLQLVVSIDNNNGGVYANNFTQTACTATPSYCTTHGSSPTVCTSTSAHGNASACFKSAAMYATAAAPYVASFLNSVNSSQKNIKIVSIVHEPSLLGAARQGWVLTLNGGTAGTPTDWVAYIQTMQTAINGAGCVGCVALSNNLVAAVVSGASTDSTEGFTSAFIGSGNIVTILADMYEMPSTASPLTCNYPQLFADTLTYVVNPAQAANIGWGLGESDICVDSSFGSTGGQGNAQLGTDNSDWLRFHLLQTYLQTVVSYVSANGGNRMDVFGSPPFVSGQYIPMCPSQTACNISNHGCQCSGDNLVNGYLMSLQAPPYVGPSTTPSILDLMVGNAGLSEFGRYAANLSANWFSGSFGR
jgi:hypothetical protein